MINGSHLPTTCNSTQVHDFIGVQFSEFSQIIEICKPLYLAGHSLKEISAMTGFAYTTVHDQFVKAGVTLRAAKSVTVSKDLRQSFKNSAPPPYGYCYLEGRLQKDAKEFPVLQIIWQQWRQGRSATDITHYLNGKKIKTRSRKEWKRTTVLNILERFENKILVLQGGNNELR